MNKKLKNQWITALRSGNYLQARDSLVGTVEIEDEFGDRYTTDDLGYCCLGVLCEVDPLIDDRGIGGEYVSYHKDVIAEAQKLWKKTGDDRSNLNSWAISDSIDLDDGQTATLLFDEEDRNKVIGVVVGENDFNSLLKKHYGLDKKVQYKNSSMPLQAKLVNFNDIERKDFNEIAQYIEKVDF